MVTKTAKKEKTLYWINATRKVSDPVPYQPITLSPDQIIDKILKPDICLSCNKKIISGKFCNSKCYGIWRSKNLSGINHPLHGTHRSVITKNKLSITRKLLGLATGTNNPSYGIDKSGSNNPNWKGGCITINCLVCGKERTIKQANKNRSKFCSRKCLGIWSVLHQKKKDTSIELAIERELKSQSIPYIKQCPIDGIAIVDFLLPNKTIIQCDGDYWHSLAKVKNRDYTQDCMFLSKDYRVFRFTETEINKSAYNCILKVTTSGDNNG
jgi:very-short-patch-repair endonuclease